MHFDRSRRRSNRYMAPLGLFPLVLVVAFSLWACSADGEESVPVPIKPSDRNSPGQVVVTYFYTTFRCPTCRKLETYSRQTVEKDFAKQMKENRIVFRAVNVEEEGNQHFIEDYGLYSKSLIVSLTRDGKEVRWKNLPDIWRLVQDREKFEHYVQGEIEAYLKDL